MNNYKIRKENEINLLKEYALSSNSALTKTQLIESIKENQSTLTNIPLSNLTRKPFLFGKNKLIYTYMRFNNKYEIKNENLLIKIKKKKDWFLKTLYFNSGMSAVSSTILSLLETGFVHIEYDNDIYFETYKLLNKHNKTRAKLNAKYFDSISLNFSLKQLKPTKKFDIIIIDSTCITESLTNVINDFIINDKIVFVVKSLTKLDMLGTEYSGLGVLTIITPKNLKNKFYNFYSETMKNVFEKMTNYNCTPMPYDFPPFWSNRGFYELNKVRINNIKRNNKFAYKILNKNSNNFKVILPNHSLFLLLYPNKSYSRICLEKICHKIADVIGKNYNFKFCDSFGFDFIGIDAFINMSDGKETIRLSCNDEDLSNISKFINFASGVFNDYL